jgi:tRNA-specific 2-thiouridylase
MAKAMNKVVAVGLSGGVDSAVAAYLLKQQGYKVFGVFMVNVEESQLAGAKCQWQADYEAARSAADHLGIPLYTWNFVHEYRDQVLNDFFAEYKKGRTPNPDVWCNEKIKFGIFLRRALQVGADFVATGHYAGVRNQKSGFSLVRGIDPSKDQSYFLYRASQQTLAHTLLPLASMKKTQIRALAKKIKLPNAGRPDSQGICFIGEVKMFDFLKQHLKVEPGSILDTRGRKVGEHRGAWFYTIGQREGLGLPKGPWYVFATDARRNIVRVTSNPQDHRLYSLIFKVTDVHWVSGKEPKLPLSCEVEVRYHQHKVRKGIVGKVGRQLTVRLAQAERAVTPGQHAVFYKGRVVVGGGVIQ